MSVKYRLGMGFLPMDCSDDRAFPDAPVGSYICYADDGCTILLLSPDENTLIEILDNGEKRYWERRL